MTGTVERLPETIATRSRDSDTILVASYGGAGEGFWTSPDGQPTPLLGGSGTILTALDLEIQQVIRGDPEGTDRFGTVGGTVGCSSYQRDPPFSATDGGRYVFFGGEQSERAALADTYLVLFDAWFVSDADVVVTPEEGLMPLADLIVEFASRAEATPK